MIKKLEQVPLATFFKGSKPQKTDIEDNTSDQDIPEEEDPAKIKIHLEYFLFLHNASMSLKKQV